MKKTKTQVMVKIALLAGFLAIISPHSLYLGPIPLSLGILGVAFCAAMLPPLQACICLGIYLMLGVVGLPVFSGYRGGPQVLLGVTGGYLLGYFALAFAISVAVKRNLALPLQLICAYFGLAICYLFGTGWYMLAAGTTFTSALTVCVLPFVLPDAVKIAVALILASEISRRLSPKARSSP